MTTAQFRQMSRSEAEGFMPTPEIQPVRMRLAELVGDRIVTDVGCGKGDEVSDLFDRRKYTGIDVSPEIVRIARKKNPKYFFLCMNPLALRPGYGCVIAKAIFEHLPPVEALELYNHLRSISGVLYVAWHTEPGKQKLTTYKGELDQPMQQNRHDRAAFEGVTDREVSGKHVIWTVI